MLPMLFQKAAARRLLSFVLAVLIITAGGWQAARAKAKLDGAFFPVLGMRNFGPESALVLPDGKILVIRQSNPNVLTEQEYKVTRLNANGSIDQIFDSVVMRRGEGRLVRQPDGKILVLAASIFAGGANRGGLVRLNPDGTLDTSFNPSGINFAGAAGILPDGKIVVGMTFYDPDYGTDRGGIFRLNADGSRDLTFTPYIYAYAAPKVVTLQPDGKILIGYGYLNSSYRIQRLNADGTMDAAFSSNLPNSSGSGSLYRTTAIIIQADGKIILGGAGVIRLNSDGTPDFAYPAYSAYGGYDVYGMIQQPDGKIVIGGTAWYNGYQTPMKKRLTRINADGTQDATFDAMTSESFGYDALIPLALKSNGNIIVSYGPTNYNVQREGLFSYNSTGTLDQTFMPDLGLVSGKVTHVKAQADGKILIAGFFARANNHPSFGIARLNPDGTTDTSFSFTEQISYTTQGVNYVYLAIAFQADGKILIGGNFRYNNQENYGVFRLNQNGSLDSTFSLQTFSTPVVHFNYSAYAIAVQADGKILVGGFFQNYGNSGRNNLVRLNQNGSVDLTYTATSTGISKMFIQPGGKIVVSGTITENGNTVTNPRLNPDGSIDPTFNMATDVGSLYAVAPNGKLATAGSFPFGQTYVVKVFRLNPDGSRDTSFAPDQFFESFDDIAIQADGQIIVSKTNGSLTRFNGAGNAQILMRGINFARALLVTPENNLIIGGAFDYVGGARRTGIARLLLRTGDYDFDGDGRADISLFRPSAGEWYILRSSSGASLGTNFGLPNDFIAPADFDGDARADISVFRPSDGTWYRLNSSNNTFSAAQFGANGDLPVPGDFDGDSRADIAVYRPSAGSWYRVNSSNNQFVAAQFGIAEDKPVIGDFDGDGKSDLTVYRSSNGFWYRINSSNNQFTAAQFGIAEDKPVASDYDGDGKSDLAVYRPSNGTWYLQNSSNNSFTATQFGVAEDKPAPADYDGDDKADLAVFRPSNGVWYVLGSTSGFVWQQYGTSGDVPAPGAFVR